MAPPPRHRANIVAASVRLLRQNGYAATGLNDIVAASGAPKGSLYHYFPRGKVSIAEAAVTEAGERVVSTLRDLSAKANSTAQLLQNHAALLAQWLQESRYRDGCPITTVLLELAPEERGITVAGRQAYAMREQILAERLMADGFGASQARRLAILCNSAIQGALIQARVECSPAPLETTARELGLLLVAQSG